MMYGICTYLTIWEKIEESHAHGLKNETLGSPACKCRCMWGVNSTLKCSLCFMIIVIINIIIYFLGEQDGTAFPFTLCETSSLGCEGNESLRVHTGRGVSVTAVVVFKVRK